MAVKSLVKAINILETLSVHGEMGVTAIAQIVDMDKSTVFRILNTLRQLGYLAQNPNTQTYRLGFKVQDLAKSQMTIQSLIDRSRPHLLKLSIEAGEASKLAVLEGSNVLILDVIESQHVIKVNVASGRQFSAHLVAIGKVILAFLPEETVRAMFEGKNMLAATNRTLTNIEALLDDLRVIRERGYAVDDEECSPGLYCLAAPVFDMGNHVVAGISVSFPILRNRMQAERDRIARLLVAAGRNISTELSGGPLSAQRMQEESV